MWDETETVAPENVWANDKAVGMTRFDDGWGTAPGFKFGGNTEEPEEESVGNVKVAWTVGQNKLVNDVADGWNRMMMMIMTYKSCYLGGEETNDKTEGSVTIIKHTSTRLLKETHPSRTLLATSVLRCIK